MQIDAGRFQCTIQPEDFGPGSTFFGGIAFKMPSCQGDLSFVMGVAEYRQFVLTPLQKLVDSYGLDCREQIGNLGGNFFFDFRLRPTGKVWCNYELSNEDRFEPERSTVFRGRSEATICTWGNGSTRRTRIYRTCFRLWIGGRL